MQRQTFAIMFIALAVVLTGCSASPQESTEREPIRVGIFGAFSGGSAVFGQQEILAAEYAAEQINGNGGINGRQLQLVYEDSRCSPKDAVTAFQKLTETTDAHIIMGGMCTGETMAAAPMANDQHIVLLSALSSAPQVTGAGDYIFRTNPVDDGAFYVQYVRQQGYRNVAIISEQTDFSQGVKDALLARFDELNISYETEDVTISDTDYRTPLLKLREAQPDLLIINTQSYKNGMPVYTQAAPLGFRNIMASRGFESITREQLRQVEGLAFYGSFGVVNESDPRVVEMRRRYEARYNTTPVSAFPLATQYDDVMLVADALRACEDPADGECLKEYLYTVKDRKGLIGVFSIDSNGDVQGIPYRAVRVRNGALEVIS